MVARADCGLDAHSVRSGAEARDYILALGEDKLILILDLGLPDIDGLEMLGSIRESLRIGTIVVSARNDRSVRLRLLALGAAGYLSKPFRSAELAAVIQSVSRRLLTPKGNLTSTWTLDIDDWALVSPAAIRIKLTETELSLLLLLWRHRGKVVSRAMICEELGNFYLFSGNALEAVISRLRRKVSMVAKDAEIIKTSTKMGYALSTSVMRKAQGT